MNKKKCIRHIEEWDVIAIKHSEYEDYDQNKAAAEPSLTEIGDHKTK